MASGKLLRHSLLSEAGHGMLYSFAFSSLRIPAGLSTELMSLHVLA
jgi:hypothetical protein